MNLPWKTGALMLAALALLGCLGQQIDKLDPNFVCDQLANGMAVFDHTADCQTWSDGDTWCVMALCYDHTNPDHQAEYANLAKLDAGMESDPPAVDSKFNMLCHRMRIVTPIGLGSIVSYKWEFVDPPSKDEAYNARCTEAQTCATEPGDPNLVENGALMAYCKDPPSTGGEPGGQEIPPATCEQTCPPVSDYCGTLTRTIPTPAQNPILNCPNGGEAYECTGGTACPPDCEKAKSCADAATHCSNLPPYPGTYSDATAQATCQPFTCPGTKVCEPEPFASAPRKYIFESGTDSLAVRADTTDNPNNYDFDPSNDATKPVEPASDSLLSANISTPPTGWLNFVMLDSARVAPDRTNGNHAWGSATDPVRYQLQRLFNITSSLPTGTGAYYGVLLTTAHKGESPASFLFAVQNAPSNRCVSPSGLQGLTGESAVPAVLLDWSWNGVSATKCAEGASYCDSTQFMIALLHQFESIDAKVNANPTAPDLTGLSQFDVQLLNDGLTDDFRKDFDSYAKTNGGAFGLAGPEYERFSGLVTNPARMAFVKFAPNGPQQELKTISAPGLYRVRVTLSQNGNAKRSPLEETAQNQLTVSLEYLHAPTTPNAFYYLPFDGLIGFKLRADETGTPNRDGYGTVLSNDTLAITSGILVKPSDQHLTGGMVLATISTPKDFAAGQVANRGRLLALDVQDLAKGTLSWSELYATPVMARLSGTTGQFYYKLRKSGVDGVVARNNQLFGWRVGAATQPAQCADGTAVDRASVSDACAAADSDSFGILRNTGNQIQVVQSVLYAPEAGYSLETVCGEMASPTETAKAGATGSQSLNLQFQRSAQTLSGLFDQVRNGEVCVVSDGSSRISFFWNEVKLFKAFDPAAQAASWTACDPTKGGACQSYKTIGTTAVNTCAQAP
jgi:hypothetical protein